MPEGSVVQHGHIISVQIEKVSPHGILVRLPDQSTGFIRRRELDGSESLQQPEEVTKIGEQLRALVLHTDPQSGLWELSVRRAHAWEQAAKQFRKGSVVRGQVFSVTDDRAYIQILPDVKAMLSISEVPLTEEQTLQDALWIDDRVVGIVTAFHPERTVMTISVSEYLAHTEHVKTKIRDRAQARKQMADALPIEAVDERVQVSQASDQVWSSPSGANPIQHVLVIDDAILFSKSFADGLRQIGYQVETVRDGIAGRDKAISDASVDLVFVDVQLGTSDGVAVAREIAAARPLLPIVLITGEDNLLGGPDASGLDVVVDLVNKPPDLDEVGVLLRGVAAGKWVRRNPLLRVGQPTDASNRVVAQKLEGKKWQDQVRDALEGLVTLTGATCVLLLEMEPGTEDARIEGRAGKGLISRNYDWNQARFSPIRDVIRGRESILELDAKSEKAQKRFRNLYPLYHFASFIGLPVQVPKRPTRYGLFLFHTLPQQFTEAHMAEAHLTARSLALAAERQSLLQTMQTFQQYALAGQLGSSLNHEIRNQLFLLEQCAKNLDLIAGGLSPQRKSTAQDVRDLQASVKSLSQANTELRELSDFYRGLTSSEGQVFDVNHMLADLKRRLHRQAQESGVDIVLELDSHLPPLRAVRARLQQACLNIMLNAIQQIGQYNHGGGLLVVSTKREKPSDPLPIKIMFDDDGPGIHSQMFERIFEPGVSTRKGGTGLGLFISQSLIESLGGKVRVKDSTLFVGTSFLIELPAPPDEGANS